MECMKHTKKEERRKGQTVHSVILSVSKLDQEQKEGAGAWSLTVALTSLQVWS